ncbi:uncharacterized protein LOC117109888 [Anneissia japonica]|uniref:uncharacterized protein LOC117109888 n=1 Tax=Anneissia japonica TaxID=1529436 RepID=UPI00142589AE|nr:uncharacterized protein LOC117109888 [Anneissia japonica]
MEVPTLHDICLRTVATLSDTLGWELMKDLPQHVLSSLIELLPFLCLNDIHDGLLDRGVDPQHVWMKHYREGFKYSGRREFWLLQQSSNECDWRQRYLDFCSNKLLRQIAQFQRLFCDDVVNDKITKALTNPLDSIVQHGHVNKNKSHSKYSPKAINIWGSACNILSTNTVAKDILTDTVEEVTFEHLVSSQVDKVHQLICHLLMQGHIHTINIKDVKSTFFNEFFKCLRLRSQISPGDGIHTFNPSHNRCAENSEPDLVLPPSICNALSRLKRVSLVSVEFHEASLKILKSLFLNMDKLDEIELIDNGIPSTMNVLTCLGLLTDDRQRSLSIIKYEHNAILGCFATIQEIIRHQGHIDTICCITHLSLEFCSMTELQLYQLFSVLSENKKMMFLSVYGNQIDSMQPSLLKLFQDGCLQGLDLGQTKFTLTGSGVTTDFVTELLATMMTNRHLRYLGLASTMLSDACLLKLATGITDEAFDSELYSIDISFNRRISPEGLRAFGQELLLSFKPTKLRYLRLQHNYTSGLESDYFKDLHNVVNVHKAGPSEDAETDFNDHVANM